VGGAAPREGGRIVARGRHEDLLASSPGYAALLTAYEDAARESDPRDADVADAAGADDADMADVAAGRPAPARLARPVRGGRGGVPHGEIESAGVAS
jgi:hypothetical protein